MRRSLSTCLALVVVSSLFASPAGAQGLGLFGGGGHARLLTFGLGGGFALPVNDARDALKNGFNGVGYARVQLPHVPLSLGVNVTFQRFDLKDAQVGSGAGVSGIGPVGGSADMFGGIGELRYTLLPGPVRPYLLVGLGAYNVKADASGAAASSSQTRFGVNGGAGVVMRLGPLSAFVQGRVDNVYTSSGGTIDAKNIQVVPVSFGVEF
jgi:Outer membrane protein beta-barrel domain